MEYFLFDYNFVIMDGTTNNYNPSNSIGIFGRFMSLDQFEILIFFSLFILIILCTKAITVLKADAKYHNASNKKTGNTD